MELSEGETLAGTRVLFACSLSSTTRYEEAQRLSDTTAK